MTENVTGGAAGATRVGAHRHLCVGSGLCAYVAPKHFAVPTGVVEVLQEGVSAQDVTVVEEAVDACPTQALHLLP